MALDVDGHRLHAGRDRLAHGRDRLAAAHLQPQVLVALHHGEGRPERLGDHPGQVDGARARADVVRPQPRLPHAEPVGDGGAGDPQVAHVGTGPRPLGVDEQVLDQPRRQRLLAPEGMLQPPPVERAHERGQHEPRDRALVAVPGVGGRDEVGLVLQHGPGQPLDPLRLGGDGVGLEQDERARPQPLGHRERRPQRRAPARDAVEGHRDPLAGRRLVLDHDGRQCGGLRERAGGVGGAGVGDDQRGPGVGEAGEAGGGRGEDALQGLGVVVGEQTHGEVDRRQSIGRGQRRLGQLASSHAVSGSRG